MHRYNKVIGSALVNQVYLFSVAFLYWANFFMKNVVLIRFHTSNAGFLQVPQP